MPTAADGAARERELVDLDRSMDDPDPEVRRVARERLLTRWVEDH